MSQTDNAIAQCAYLRPSFRRYPLHLPRPIDPKGLLCGHRSRPHHKFCPSVCLFVCPVGPLTQKRNGVRRTKKQTQIGVSMFRCWNSRCVILQLIRSKFWRTAVLYVDIWPTYFSSIEHVIVIEVASDKRVHHQYRHYHHHQ